MNKKRHPQKPPPPQNTTLRYTALRPSDTSNTTQQFRGADTTNPRAVGADNFIPIAPTNFRQSGGGRFGLREILGSLGILGIMCAVVFTAADLLFKYDSLGEKLSGLAHDVSRLLESSEANQVRLDQVKSDVVELRHEIKEGPRGPVAPVEKAAPPSRNK
jgi:hypothetical protein